MKKSTIAFPGAGTSIIRILIKPNSTKKESVQLKMEFDIEESNQQPKVNQN